MALNDWSERIVIAELADEPALSEDLDALIDRIDRTPGNKIPDVIVNMAGVSHLNSSNIAQLLRLRKVVAQAGRRLRMCSLNDQVWSVILTANIDGLFTFNDDVATALAGLQIEA